MRYLFVLLLLVSMMFMAPSVQAQGVPQGDCEWTFTPNTTAYNDSVQFYGATKNQCLHGPYYYVGTGGGPLGTCVWRWTRYDKAEQQARYMYAVTQAQCTGYTY